MNWLSRLSVTQHSCDLSTQEAEKRGLLQVPDQSRLHCKFEAIELYSEILYKKKIGYLEFNEGTNLE